MIPGLHIGTDIIAGFPGETEDDFNICADFVNRMKFANQHVFTYSPRPGTPASEMPDRPDRKTAERRAAVLRKIGEENKKSFIRSQLGKELQVVWETVSAGICHGWSDHYIPVAVPQHEAVPGRISTVLATEKNLGLEKMKITQSNTVE